MSNSLFKQVEEKLSELINIVDEKTYLDFINNDPYLQIFDMVANLENNDDILTNIFLEKILKLVNSKVDMYK